MNARSRLVIFRGILSEAETTFVPISNDTMNDLRGTTDRQHAKIALCGIVILASLIVFYFPLLTGQRTLVISDHCFYVEPLSRYLGESFRQGRLPLWNPYLYCGMSEIAVPDPGLFYPGTLSNIFLPYSQALAWQMVAHQFIMAAGMFLLIISLGWGMVSAIVAALIAAFNGYMFSLSTSAALAKTVAWLPISLWSYQQIDQQRGAGDKRKLFCQVALAAVFTFLFISAGRPEIFIPGLAAIVLFNLIKGIFAIKLQPGGAGRATARTVWRWQSLAMLIGILLALPVIVPSAEWTILSPRASGIDPKEALLWSANWYDFICFVFSQPFGDLQVLGAPLLAAVTARKDYLQYVPSAFVGPICLTFALWGFTDRSWSPSQRLLLLFGLAISLSVSLGQYTPIAPLMVHVFSRLIVFRYPVKWLIFVVLSLAIAAGRGAFCCFNKSLRSSQQITTLSLWIFCLLVSCYFYLAAYHRLPSPFPAPAIPQQAAIDLSMAMVLSAVLGLLTCAVGYLRSKNLISAKPATYLVVAALASNLLWSAAANRQMTADASFYQVKPLLRSWLDKIKPNTKSRLLNLYFDPLHLPSSYKYQSGKNWTISFFAYSRNLMLCNTNMDAKTPSTFGYGAAKTGFYERLIADVISRSASDTEFSIGEQDNTEDNMAKSDLPLFRFCQCTGTSWLTTQVCGHKGLIVRLDPSYFNLVKEDKDQNLRLYKIKSHAPRAYFSHYWRWVNNKTELANKMVNAEETGFDPLTLPLIIKSSAEEVEQPVNPLAPQIGPPPDREPALTRHSPPPQSYNVSVLQDDPEHVSLSLAVPYTGFVVLADHFYPGWKASVDGVPAPIYMANAETRAVYVPAGGHLIEFNYRPDSLFYGFIGASIGLLLLAGLCSFAAAPSVWRFIKWTAGQ